MVLTVFIWRCCKKILNDHFFSKGTFKKVLTWLWSFVIVFVIIFIIYHPEILSATFLQKNISHYQGMVWPIYLGLLLIRVPLLVPTTPLLFLGLLLFPESKLLTVLLVMISSLISATFFYYFAGNTGWYRFLLKKYPKQTEKAEILMNKANAVWIVVLWSFIPIAPGDLICYIAGIVRMPFRVLLFGVVIGTTTFDAALCLYGAFVFMKCCHLNRADVINLSA